MAEQPLAEGRSIGAQRKRNKKYCRRSLFAFDEITTFYFSEEILNFYLCDKYDIILEDDEHDSCTFELGVAIPC